MAEDITDRLDDPPSNWGRWGDEDELGTLNHRSPESVLAGVAAVEKGEVYTLGVPVDRTGESAPAWPGRGDPDQYMTVDEGHIRSGKIETPDGVGVSEDDIHLCTHTVTHFDALGHVWYNKELYNGFDAETTAGGLEWCSIEPMASQGVVGRGVLLDIARHREVEYLPGNSEIPLAELEDCLDEQGVSLQSGDVILVRTGAYDLFAEDPEAYVAEYESEREELPNAALPGITYSDELLERFDEAEIAAYGTDTLAFEQSVSSETGSFHPLHPPALRDLGLCVCELQNLSELGAECADDGKYEFLYVGAPLPVRFGTAGPANPIVIK